MSDIYHIGAPVFLPERHSQLGRLIRESLNAALPELLEALTQLLDEPGPQAFCSMEERVLGLFQVASSHVVAGALVLLHGDVACVETEVVESQARMPWPVRSRGWRTTRVRFLGGACLEIETPYASEDLRGRPGKTRGIGRRRVAGSGCYPMLESLGIADRATPALRSAVAKQVVRSASLAEAREALAERGIVMDLKTVRSISLRVGTDALAQRQARLDAARAGAVFSEEFKDQRIAIGVDGGRLRLREGGRRGRKGKKGRRRYATPWREPKLLSVYVIDERGKKVREVPMLYDATLEDADATFEILAAELKLRGAAEAKEIILIADGAPWIWNRADALAEALGLDPKKIVRVADFYHAVEHLTAITELLAGWSDEKKKRWVRKMRHWLLDGRVNDVIHAAAKLCLGRKAAKIRVEVAYFAQRKKMMRYHAFNRRGIPIGSGAVESAIRRVINLRLKGPSIFWRKGSAERMLHMRSYFKAGRWDELMRRVMCASPSGVRESQICGRAA